MVYEYNTFIDRDYPPLTNKTAKAKDRNYALKVTSNPTIRNTGKATLFNPYQTTSSDSGTTYQQRPDFITG